MSLAAMKALKGPSTPAEALERPISAAICIDFETFYDGAYSLSKLTTTDYVRDSRFQVIGVGVKVNNAPAIWMGEPEFKLWAAKVDWKRTAVLCHNTAFDGAILSWRFGIRPGFLLDTLSMARALHGTEVGGSLAKLATHYQVGEKGHEVHDAKGKRLEDFTPDELAQYGEYCKNDVELTYRLFGCLSEGFPENELWLIDTTLRMFTEPEFRVDCGLLGEFLVEERERKKSLLDRVALDRSILMSNDKFAALLMEMGVTPPTKISVAKSKKAGFPVETWAFSKSDPGMKALLDHEREEVRWVAEARIGVKSTINETRTERFLKLGANGQPAPVLLKYYGAHTGRWCMKPDSEILTPAGWVRMDQFASGEILQWRPDGSLEWAHAEMQAFDFSGELERVNSGYIRGSFTPEHKIPTWTTTGTFKPRTAAAASRKNTRIPVSGVLATAPGLEISDALIRLWVAVQADGTIEDPQSRPLRFKFRKERKMERLRQLLTDAGLPWTEFDTPPERAFSIARRHVPAILWGAKRFSWEFLKFSAHQRKVFLEELRYWDGAVNRELLCYQTCVRENAEIVATVALLDGQPANIYHDHRSQKNPIWSDAYTVTLREATYAHVTPKQWSKEAYGGRVYCPKTITGYFVVRAEGRVYVTGNSGSDRTNFQNLERTNKKDPRKGRLRKALMAPPGKVLVVADSAQIEARMVAWIAGQEDLLQAFGENRDVYSEFASVAYGRKIDRKKVKEDEVPGHVGKTCVLGLGYALGAMKLGMTLLQGAAGPSVQFTETDAANMGVDIEAFTLKRNGQPDRRKLNKLKKLPIRLSWDERLAHFAVAAALVRRYRETNHAIAKFWRRAQGFLETMAAGEQLNYGPLSIGPWGVRLPSGRVLRYGGLEWNEPPPRDPDADEDEDDDAEEEFGGFTYWDGRKRKKIYGGMLTENIVQALARDVVAEQKLWARAAVEPMGGRVTTSTHDEIVLCVLQEHGKEALEKVLAIMKTPPFWAKGLPLNAEGGFAIRYGDAK